MAKDCDKYYLEKMINEIDYISTLVNKMSFEKFSSNILIKIPFVFA